MVPTVLSVGGAKGRSISYGFVRSRVKQRQLILDRKSLPRFVRTATRFFVTGRSATMMFPARFVSGGDGRMGRTQVVVEQR
jgi:hypothetical protein